MSISWTDDLARIDWREASALYRAAPLGDKAPADLEARVRQQHVSGLRVRRGRTGRRRKGLGGWPGLRLSLRYCRAAEPSGNGPRQGDCFTAGPALGVAQEDHPVRRAGQGGLLRGLRLRPHDDGHGDLCRSRQGLRRRVSARGLSSPIGLHCALGRAKCASFSPQGYGWLSMTILCASGENAAKLCIRCHEFLLIY